MDLIPDTKAVTHNSCLAPIMNTVSMSSHDFLLIQHPASYWKEIGHFLQLGNLECFYVTQLKHKLSYWNTIYRKPATRFLISALKIALPFVVLQKDPTYYCHVTLFISNKMDSFVTIVQVYLTFYFIHWGQQWRQAMLRLQGKNQLHLWCVQ